MCASVHMEGSFKPQCVYVVPCTFVRFFCAVSSSFFFKCSIFHTFACSSKLAYYDSLHACVHFCVLFIRLHHCFAGHGTTNLI